VSAVEQWRLRLNEANEERILREVEISDASWEVWSDAWDTARVADEQAGRRYDKRIYAERAHDARLAFLRVNGLEHFENTRTMREWCEKQEQNERS
jgi:hypothetical protein